MFITETQQITSLSRKLVKSGDYFRFFLGSPQPALENCSEWLAGRERLRREPRSE